MGLAAIAATIREVLGSSCQVAVQPDIPHLAVAPDILIGRKGKLVGLFLPSREERRDPTSLLVRLALARLGLPSHLVCILVHRQRVGGGHQAVRQRWESLEANFDGSSDIEGLRQQVQAFVEATPAPRGTGYAAVRQQCRERYAVLVEISLRFQEQHPADHSPPEILDQMVSQFGFVPAAPGDLWELPAGIPDETKCLPAKTVSKNGFIASYVSFQDSRSPESALLPYVNLSVQNDYGLADGTLYARAFAAKCLAVGRFPRGALDPGKLLHAAAFAGWALVGAPSAPLAVQVMEDISGELKMS
jgi:hypothetical protein